METVKKQLPYDVKVTDVMKQLALMWKSLPTAERERYERIAEADKTRYFAQMESYTGPMRVPNKRQKKPEGAPKRAMSAFLSFSQMMRPTIRTQQPHLKNTEISSVLAERWKNASEEEKRPHLEKEIQEREKYHNEMLRWKEEESARLESLQNKQSIPSPPSTEGLDFNTYATLLEGYMDDGLDSEIEGLIYDTGQCGSESSASGSSRSHSYKSSSNRSGEVPDSEMSIGPGMYALAPPQQQPRSVSSSSQSTYSNDVSSLPIFQGWHSPLGTYLHVPAPGARASDRSASLPPKPSDARQMQPPVRRVQPASYWLDDKSMKNERRLMDQAFGQEAPLQRSSQQERGRGQSFKGGDNESRRQGLVYGSISNINHTLSAVTRASMFDGIDDSRSVPRDMTPLWTFPNDPNDDKATPSVIRPQYYLPEGVRYAPQHYSAEGVRHSLPSRPYDSILEREMRLVRERKEDEEKGQARAMEWRRQLQARLESNIDEDCRAFLSSPSDEGDSGSPLEK